MATFADLLKRVGNKATNLVQNVRAQAQALPEYTRQTQFAQNLRNTLNQPVPQNTFTKPLISAANVGLKVQPYFNKFAEGGVEASTLGLADVPVAPSQNPAEKFLYGAGYATGLFNPFNPVNKVGLLPKVGSVGSRAIAPVTKLLTNRATSPVSKFVASKVVPSVGSEAAQTAAFGLAKGVVGQEFNPLTDFGVGLLGRGTLGRFAPDMPTAKGLKGISPRSYDVHPEDAKIMQDFVVTVQTGGKSKAIDALGQDAQRLAEHYIGKKAATLSNTKLAQAFDAILSDNAKRAGEDVIPTNFPKMGFAQSKSVGQILEGKTPKDIGVTLKSPDTVLKEASNEIERGISQTKKPFKQNLKDFYTDWVNRFQPIEDVANTLEKTGIKMKSSNDPRIAIKRLLGAGGVAELRHKKELNPILDELGDVSKSDFDVYLKAKRDIELGGRGIKGSDPVLAQQRIEALSQKYDTSKLDGVAQKLYQYQDKSLQMLRENGFLDEAGYNTIKDVNQNYVPFQRVMDEVDNYLGLPTAKAAQSANPIQKIQGSERAIYSPLESVIANTYKTEAAIAKNRVAKSLVDLVNVDPNLQGVFQKVAKAGDNTIPVWENGKKSFYTAPEDIIRSVKGLNEEGMGTVTKILSAPARLLRQGATGRNIDFMIPNVFKDQFDAAINSKYGYIPFVDYLSGLASLINYNRTGSDEIVEGWIKSGGQIFFENMSGRKEIAKQVSDAVEGKKAIQKIGDWVLGGLDVVGKYSEQPTRIGLYKRALKATNDPLLAAAESREGTLDFARMGAKMKLANSLIPFFNVGVQGFDKLIRTAKNDPKAFALRMGMYGVAPAATIAVYNNQFHPEEYSEIPQYVKDTNFVLVTGRDKDGRPTYLTFPKGNVLPLIANPVDNFISYLAGTNQQSFGQLALNLLGDTLPIVEGGENIGEAASRTIGANLPQFLKPAIEAKANYSFFKNQPIVPSYLQDELPENRTKKNTEGVYNYLGGVLGQSPLQIENFAEGTLAGFAKTPLNAIETIQSATGPGEVDINKIPVVRRFVGKGNTPEETAKYQTYDLKDQLKKEAQMATRKPFLERLIPSGEAGAAETISKPTTAKDKIIFDERNKQTKEKIKLGQSVTNEELINAYIKEPLASNGSEYQNALKENNTFKQVGSIYSEESLSEEQKDVLFEALGVDKQTANKYNVAKQNEELRFYYVKDALGKGNQEEVLLSLRSPVGGEQILTDGVINLLEDEGLIDNVMAKALKSVKFDKLGNLKEKKSGTGGKTAKQSYALYQSLQSKNVNPLKYSKAQTGSSSSFQVKLLNQAPSKRLSFKNKPLEFKIKKPTLLPS